MKRGSTLSINRKQYKVQSFYMRLSTRIYEQSDLGYLAESFEDFRKFMLDKYTTRYSTPTFGLVLKAPRDKRITRLELEAEPR